MHVGIVAQRGNPRAAELAEDIRRALDARVSLDAETAESLGVEGRAADALVGCDLVVSIGGDGTFLYTARAVGDTPIMGVNLGEVGFLNATPPDDAIRAVRAEVARLRSTDDPGFQEMAQVKATGDGFELPAALNEVTVLGPQRGHGQGVGIEVRLDGELYTGSRADGVIVATPTGSTAYNLSEGGPLVHPDVNGFVVTEMCAEGPMPPLVVDPDRELTVRVEEAERAYVVADGRTKHEVTPPTRIRLQRAERPVRVAGPPLDFFAALGKLD
ncbi:NAD(+)/NADH kinase [Halorarius litoreus]|uniref:NAD(+)/NADH kinase n=1 Tax=Halorarius litoreus TaxID=2962676 RepID=UPI0020CF8DC9|nr:NAD(+)/NADH kinase [Halorarius litoreus]